jgi:hypothetical protein
MSLQLVTGPDAIKCGIEKRIVNRGTKSIDFVDGTKVFIY